MEREKCVKQPRSAQWALSLCYYYLMTEHRLWLLLPGNAQRSPEDLMCRGATWFTVYQRSSGALARSHVMFQHNCGRVYRGKWVKWIFFAAVVVSIILQKHASECSRCVFGFAEKVPKVFSAQMHASKINRLFIRNRMICFQPINPPKNSLKTFCLGPRASSCVCHQRRLLPVSLGGLEARFTAQVCDEEAVASRY